MERKKIIEEITGKENNIVVDKKTADSVNKILNGKVPQETNFRSMAPPPKGFRRLWRPNNYRRQMVVKEKGGSTIEKVKSALLGVSISSSNNLLFVPFEEIKIQYGKTVLTAIYSQKFVGGEKEVFVIEASSVAKIEEWIRSKKKEIESQLDKALFSFARKFKIVKPLEKPIWSRHEDWTVDEEIKKIPGLTIIQGEHMKKVYPEGVEYVGGMDVEPTSQLINRVRNTGLRDFAPDIVSELEHIRINQNPLNYLKENVQVLDDIFNFKDVISDLRDFDREEFERWLFERFGVTA